MWVQGIYVAINTCLARCLVSLVQPILPGISKKTTLFTSFYNEVGENSRKTDFHWNHRIHISNCRLSGVEIGWRSGNIPRARGPIGFQVGTRPTPYTVRFSIIILHCRLHTGNLLCPLIGHYHSKYHYHIMQITYRHIYYLITQLKFYLEQSVRMRMSRA